MRGWATLCLAVVACRFDTTANGTDPDGPTVVIDGPSAAVDGMIDGVVDGPLAPPDASPPDASPPDASPPDASPPDASSGCPDNYALGPNGTYFRVSNTVRTWAASQSNCEDDGPGIHLAVMDDGEFAFVDDLYTGTAWIGASDRVTEGEYLWMTNGFIGASSARWDSGEPNNNLNQDCVTLNENRFYEDFDCASLRISVCECDGIAADPSRY